MSTPPKKSILREFDLGEGSNLALDLEAPAIEASGTLLVYVADAKGLPIRDADVWVEGNGQTYTTGQQVIGVGYSIEAKPGNYVLKVSHGGTTITKNVAVEVYKPDSNPIPKTISIRFEK